MAYIKQWTVNGTTYDIKATALTTSAGSSSIPVYFSSGQPVAISNLMLSVSNTNDVTISASNSNGRIGLHASTNRGVYDFTKSAWMIYNNTAGSNTYIPKWASKGSATQPVYFNSSGEPVACTAYSSASVNYASSAGNADTVDGYHANSFVFCSGTAVTDLNNMTTSGFYRVNSGHSNSPGDWGQLIVCHGGADTITQIYGHYSNGALYTRSGNPSQVGGSGSYTAWKYLWRQGDSVTSAVWNDYAEYREVEINKPGYVVYEKGDDSMACSYMRLQKGCSIISDTWGFAQGETDKAKTPIAVSGRVLAYPYENREEFRNHIGDAVCSGPGGTVSLMTNEEIKNYPLSIIGTISAVPDYEEWGGGENADREPVKVNGRVWIQIK